MKVHKNGVAFTDFLGLLFVGLKLGGVIGWSWWWVTAPFWVPLAIVILGAVAATIMRGQD